MTSRASEQPDQQSEEAYVFAGTQVGSRHLAFRTAEQQAAFFLPYLRPGMELLDCGCGPGSITAGLARMVAPGRVVGVDVDAGQIELAQSLAADQTVANLRFETATIYGLPFPDHSFDAVYSNAVLIFLQDPLAALREIHRVLRPGGVVGIRTSDHDGQLCAPPDPLLMRFWQILNARVEHDGGNAFLGKQVRGLLRQAGFVQVQAGASYECYSTAEATRGLGEFVSHMLQGEDYIQSAVNLGLAERAELEHIRHAWLEWGENPDAFFADPFCEAVGWKE